MGRARLIGLTYSPWTERARWALDHHGVTYTYQEHVPLLGEPLLRWQARGAGEVRATVPLLRADGQAIGDSLKIMQWADARGDGSLRAAEPEVAAWAARVEPALSRGRQRITHRTLASPAVLREAAATAMPDALAGVASPVAAAGARFIAKKYGFDPDAPEPELTPMIEVMEAIRAALDGGEHVVGDALTAADLLAASAVQMIQPVGDAWVRLAPATRGAWTVPELAARFEDVVAWRDRLYAAHRARR